MENSVIDVLRKKYPQNVDSNLDLYFNNTRKRFHDFSILLDNLENRKDEFGPDTQYVSKFLEKIKPFKDKANSTTHSIIKNPEEKQVVNFHIRENNKY